MEAVLLFCCRSCLKGERDTLYYDLLGLEDRKASPDAIKAAYKKKSLELHPDRLARKGIQVTPEHNQEFQKLKEAYDILSDPRKRRLYDQLGASGIKLIDSPQDVNPQELIRNFQSNRSDRVKIGVAISLIFSAILIFPILFCLKCDGRMDSAPWLAIWTPMWLVNAIMVISSILFVMEKEPEPEDGENAEPLEKIPLTTKLLFASKTFAFVTIQIFVLMRLDHEIHWSWFTVFIPWYIYEFLSLLEKIPVAIFPVPEIDQSVYSDSAHVDEETGETMTPEIHIIMMETERHRKLIEQATMRVSLVVSVLRVWFALLLAAQLDDDISWDWGLVMFPVWAYFLVELIAGYLLRQWGIALVKEADVDLAAVEAGLETDPIKMMKLQHGTELMAAGPASCCMISPLLLMAILLVSRLDSSAFSAFIIILPVFIIIGCCICGVGCGLCCLSFVDAGEGSEVGSDDPTTRMMRQEEQHEESAEYVPPKVDDVMEAKNGVVSSKEQGGDRVEEAVSVNDVDID